MPGEAPRKAGNNEDSNVRSRSLNDVPRLLRTVNPPMYRSYIPSENCSDEHGQPSTEALQCAGVDIRVTPKGHEYRKASQNELHRPPIRKLFLPPPYGAADPEVADESLRQIKLDHARSIFRALEDYIVTCFGSFDCINSSFSTSRPPLPARSVSEGTDITLSDRLKSETPTTQPASISGLDAKTLLLGDFAENGSWWTGGRPQRNRSQRIDHPHNPSLHSQSPGRSVKASNIDWAELDDFYQSIIKAGSSWESKWEQLSTTHNENKSRSGRTSGYIPNQLQAIGSDLAEARLHTQRTLLKVTETILKRPGRPLKSPEDCRFLLILLANPLLYSSNADGASCQRSLADKRGGPGQHSGIIKRIFGLLANLPNQCHYYLVAWFSRFSEFHFRRLVDLVGSFVTYRLTRQHNRKRSSSHDPTAELIPSFSGVGVATSAQLHAALGVAGPSRNTDGKTKTVLYHEDWQLKAAARLMSLLFSANSNRTARRFRTSSPAASPSTGIAARQRAHTHGQMLPTSDFYNTLLDYSDIIADFEAWESRRGKFSFCQYPFFYSIWAKIHILEYDARRQMEIKAREAFFTSIMGRKAISQYLVLKIRRDCLVEDSLRGVSENVGSGQEDIKKSLKIEFLGEEGVDAGGLRKEWFLLLVREVFDPHHGGSLITLILIIRAAYASNRYVLL